MRWLRSGGFRCQGGFQCSDLWLSLPDRQSPRLSNPIMFAGQLRQSFFPRIRNRILRKSTRDEPIFTQSQRAASPELRWVDGVSRLLDTRFRIPGTKIRFGGDFLMGLIPGVGDVVSMGFSAVLIATMAKNGASARLVLQMLLNVLLDTVVGTVPILGNVFDLFYKANYRNAVLMREYYDQNKHRGSVWPLIAGVAIVLLLWLALTIWLLVILLGWLFG